MFRRRHYAPVMYMDVNMVTANLKVLHFTSHTASCHSCFPCVEQGAETQTLGMVAFMLSMNSGVLIHMD